MNLMNDVELMVRCQDEINKLTEELNELYVK